MNPPKPHRIDQTPFGEHDLEVISRRCGETYFARSGGSATVEEVMDDWDLRDGSLVCRPDVGTMRVGHGTVDGEAAWWVEVPSGNTGWNYHAHFPGIFTGEWVYWLYSQWLA